LRLLQERIQRRVLSRLPPSPFNHGGVKGRSIRSNVSAHRKSRFALTLDIEKCFPNIRRERVFDVFREDLDCSQPVAAVLTRLCTLDHRLAQGLVTSPALCNAVLWPLDRRLNGIFSKRGCVYTRFVDDLTISGPYELEDQIPLITTVLNEFGREVADKTRPFAVESGETITGLRINRSAVDVGIEFLERLEADVENASVLANGGASTRPFVLHSQILGRIHFVRWIRSSRFPVLKRRVNGIDWEAAQRNAEAQGLIREKPELVRRRDRETPLELMVDPPAALVRSLIAQNTPAPPKRRSAEDELWYANSELHPGPEVAPFLENTEGR
jgi:retron-type reverse transcriptase